MVSFILKLAETDLRSLSLNLSSYKLKDWYYSKRDVGNWMSLALFIKRDTQKTLIKIVFALRLINLVKYFWLSLKIFFQKLNVFFVSFQNKAVS